MLEKSILKYLDKNEILFKNIKCSIYSTRGNKDKMEDVYVINNEDGIFLAGIFDGHGGDEIAIYLSKNIKSVKDIIGNPTYLDYNKINKFFINMDKDILKLYPNTNSGSTCTLVIIVNDHILFINLGDSTSIYFNSKIYYKTKPHRPNKNVETNRILLSNNFITNNNGTYRINNSLAVSRSFGDYKYKFIGGKYNGVISASSIIPSISILNKINKSKIIMGSDGLFDFIDDEDILFYRKKTNYPVNIINKAIKYGSKDNIMLIMIDLV